MNVKEENVALLKTLSDTDGISGMEQAVSRVAREYATRDVDGVEYDSLGSLILEKRGLSTRRIMFSAHMDEVGFLVREINEKGFIRLQPIGGWWGHVMAGNEMRITTREGKQIVGVIGSREPHGISEAVRNQVEPPLNQFLDIGVRTRLDAENLGVRIGDMITPNTMAHLTANEDTMIGKAWDNRTSVAILLRTLRRLSGEKVPCTLDFALTAQEEVGIRGARTAVHTIKPDLAVVLDVTAAFDNPLEDNGIRLGDGIVIRYTDSRTLGDLRLVHQIKTIARELDIKTSDDYRVTGGTDACNIHKALKGVPTVVLSIPVRYMHSPRSVLNLNDFEQLVTVLTRFCQKFDGILPSRGASFD